jgi:hypothetical protein
MATATALDKELWLSGMAIPFGHDCRMAPAGSWLKLG